DMAVGYPVEGNRHHYWRLNPADPDATLAAHSSAGFLYDCSVAFSEYPGWRRGTSLPFAPYDGSSTGTSTLQLPTAWMDAQLFADSGDKTQTEGRRYE